ncbi:MAG: zinc-dependent peptidase [Phycisphaerae bacterium]|nr:zinc-dependent peptidase [Phycisphaerae bacterium]
MGWLKRWRRARVTGREFPAGWRAIIERNVPYRRLLPEAERAELERHVLVFLAEKSFEGLDGQAITDEVRVTIAAQACLLLLHRRTDYFPGMRTVLVTPRVYEREDERHLDWGLVEEGVAEFSGESWHRGPVVLAWDDVLDGAADIDDGFNVVLHEFAHQIDATGGQGDSSAVLQGGGFAAWAAVLGREYERFAAHVRRGRRTLLDEYGAEDPSEFFAVATEYFYEKPVELSQEHPELYRQLSLFYEQDPKAWRTGL